IGVILTANYTFLNYLALGFLLLDDRFLVPFVLRRWKAGLSQRDSSPPEKTRTWEETSGLQLRAVKLSLVSVMLCWIFYATTVQLIWMLSPRLPLPTAPVSALEPFRIANQYGLFAVMTRGRYEIEFQGSQDRQNQDRQNWVAYPFRYKPQDPSKPPGIYAPYQPRFDWNLWFASLGSWREYPIVPNTEVRLLENDADVLALFAANPFPRQPPTRYVRCSGNTGSPPWQKSSRPECGGAGNWLDCMLRLCNARLMAESASPSGRRFRPDSDVYTKMRSALR